MKRLLLVAFSIIALLGGAVAQPVSNKLTPEKKLKIADERLQAGDIVNALDFYTQVQDEDKKNTYALNKLGEVNFQLRDFREAEKWFVKLVTADTKNEYPLARFTLGRILKMNEKYDEAVTEFNKFMKSYAGADAAGYKSLAANEIQGAEMAAEEAKAEESVVTNLGDKVNSPFTEFGTAPTGRNTIYYSSIRSKEAIVLDNPDNQVQYAKIYKAERSGTSYGEGKALPATVNKNNFHNGQATLSADGNRMYFTRCELQNNVLKRCDIFVTTNNGGNWTEATPVSVNNPAYTVKQPAIGMLGGKEYLIFSSDMPGGKGGYDLYYAERKADGSFSTALSMGGEINTFGNEETPFIAKDGTVFFSSDGLPTMGGYDVFSTTMVGGSWAKPKNEGAGVNSRVDDLYFTLADECFGYVVSNRPGTTSLKSETCCDDIFEVKLPERCPLMLTVTTFKKKDNSALSGVTVKLIDESTGKEVESKTNNASNTFSFPLQRNKTYKITGDKTGFLTGSANTNTNLKDVFEAKTLEVTVALGEPEVPKPEQPPVVVLPPLPILKNIYYDFDKADIRKDAVPVLEEILGYLNKYPVLVIELNSHTDAKGSDAYNDALSAKRTASALAWLEQKGIAKSRLMDKSSGERLPAAPNDINGKDSPEGRQLNRRTEFKIIKGAETFQQGQPTGSNATPADKKKIGTAVAFFDKPVHDLGIVKKGEKRRHTFTLKNTGKEDLLIEFVSGSCGCTVPEQWTKDPIPPGKTADITVEFDSKEKDLGQHEITVDVIANTNPIVTELKVKVNVVK